MYMTQQDVNNLLQFAALSAAQKLGVSDSGWEPTDKLAAAVRSNDPTLGAALDSFVEAYLAWFEFGERISAGGNDGKMTPFMRIWQRAFCSSCNCSSVASRSSKVAIVFSMLPNA